MRIHSQLLANLRQGFVKHYSVSTMFSRPAAMTQAGNTHHILPSMSLGGIRFFANVDAPHLELGMPALSPTMEFGTIAKWLKNVGDEVQSGDIIAQIETDKANIDWEMTDDGYVARIYEEEGAKVALGTPCIVLCEEEEDIPKFKDCSPGEAGSAAESAPTPDAAPSAPTPAATLASTPATTPASTAAAGDRVVASPLAKHTAETLNVTLSAGMAGSGPNGRILAADVAQLASSTSASASAHVATPAAPTPAAVIPAMAGIASGQFTDTPVTTMRSVIASRLTESKVSIPHYYLTMSVEMDAALALRQELNKLGDADSFKLSVNDLVIKAASLAMRKVPEINSSWQGDFIRQYHSVDVSVAVATPNGLLTPIIKAAERKGLSEISNEMKSLASRAKTGGLKPEEFQGGTFTISNLGMFGISHFTAIINPPQACILAVGGTEVKVLPGEHGGVRKAQVMNVTLSCDHRVVDGATGAQWLQAFKALMEQPNRMML